MSTTDPLGAPPSDSEHSVSSISKCDTSTSQPSDDEWTDDDGFAISPVPGRSPPRGTRWTRFFPELSSHFSLVSPISTTIPKVTPFSLVAEMQAIDHQNRQNPSDSGTRTDSPSLSASLSEDTFDTTSSCYSRRSSVTSLGSELAGCPYRSADAFSVISPIAAGVFDDDTATVLVGLAPKLAVKGPSLEEVRNKPLPREPPIALAPLSVRRKGPRPLQASEHFLSDQTRTTTPASPATQVWRSQRTLSQAAEELENVLAGITEQRHNEPNLLSSQIFNGPLQISRGNMDMIATRPAPSPPTNIASVKSNDRSSRTNSHGKSERDLRKTMKKSTKNKGPFSFAVPGFSRKYTNPHLRSFSSSSLKSEVESPSYRPQRPPRPETIADEAEDTAEVAEYSLPIPSPRQRPSSFGSERELRLRLPRLQTKQVRSHEDLIFTSSLENRPVAERSIPGIRTNNAEKIFVASSKAGRLNTPDMIFELEGGLPQRMVYELEGALPSPHPKITISVHKPRETTVQLPDDITLKILEQVSSLDDLFHLAVVSGQYYRVFKQHELQLMKTAVYRMSPPAWELREMSPPWDSEWQILVDPDAPVPEYTPTLYLQRYAQDIYTLAQLKSLILARCNTFLRQETINGLTGKDDTRAAEIDDAFWRIWTFCRIFGCGKNRENDIVGQMDWLNGGVMARDRNSIVTTSLTEPFGMNNVLFEPPEGFGRGNGGGLSQSQLYDMNEIWTCLAVLLQPIHGSRTEARKAGVFDGLDIAENDTVKEEAMIEEWTYYVLTLGPSAVLSIGSICPFNNAEATFQTAQSIGLTKWEPCDSEISRSTFLKEAVSRAYKAREGRPSVNAPRLSNASSTSSGSSAGREKTSQTNSNSTDNNQSNRRRQAVFAAQLRNRRTQQNTGSPITFAEERPISSYAMIMRRLEGLPSEQPPPLPTQPVLSPASQSPRYCSPTPVQYSQLLPPPPPPTANPLFYRPQVLDPVDQAIHTMVHELGFKEEDAKWALKITDNGEGIDANAAVALLTREQERYEQRRSGRFAFRSKSPSLLESVINSQESVNSGWRWA
ncbi:hypothetical protein CNMCM6106_001618 [Aspergillus hiratsukae]|uniref:F-box domain protein n=1 Tax=Aspergillus hiratsukae TaxID=1194566 RepID=A0A8H6UTL1_9EURO|nr:hypothetical protein CNMCM6106_001618 [Aspergillus hiratsukae]